MDRIRTRKIDLINEINAILLLSRGRQINSLDFDQLWDLDIDQLQEVKHELLRQSAPAKARV